MLIPPEEFLKRTRHLGFTSCMFKHAMVQITENSERINQTIKEGKDFYFSYDGSQAAIRFFVSTDDEIDEHDNETSTHAFKLLKLIAE